MASSDQRQPDSTNEHATAAGKRQLWPVSLFGCLEHVEGSSASQMPWPWFLFKACLCPAAALGANETLYQEEEPADICCLQPHSLCGPTCRELNAQLCGLGNEGFRLCAHTCILQAACSCLCLGLPLVAWATALQRQRVAAKHSVQDTDEDFWATTAFFPCSLLQIHTLLLQQQQQPCRQAAAPYKAPKVQQMAASECASVGQAPSAAGPLTSGMSTSKLLRAVRTQSTRSESVAQPRGRTAGSRLGDSISSDTSSGVVDNPYGLEQADTDLPSEEVSAACLSEADSNSAAAAMHQQQQQRRSSHDGQQHSSGLEHCNSSSRLPTADGPLHMGSPCLTARTGTGSRPSSRGGTAPASGPSSNGGCAVEPGPLSARLRTQGQGAGSHQHSRNAQLPPKHRSSINGTALPSRAVSSGGGRPSTSGAGTGSSAAVLPAPQPATSPEPLAAAEPAAAEAAIVAGLLGQQRASSSSIAAAVPATAAADGCAGPAAGVTGNYRRSAGSLSQAGGLGSSADNLTGSRLSVAGSSSSSKLQLSQEDVPLLAIKPCPGRVTRGMSIGLSSSKGMLGKGSLAGSWQQQSSGSDKQLIAVGRSSQDPSAAASSSSNATSSSAHSRPLDSSNGAAGGSGAAALQVNPQYATMQSDICNFASWLGGAGASTADLHASSAQLPQQQLLSRQQSIQEEEKEEDNVQHQVHTRSVDGARGAGVAVQPPPSPPPPQQLSRGPSANLPSFGSDGSEQLGPLDPAVRQDSGLLSVNISKSPCSSSKPKTASILAGAGARNGAAAAAAAGGGSGGGAQQAAGGRARMSDWAYMSDLCNLGGSFEMNCSTGLAAALGRLAEEGYEETALEPVDKTDAGYKQSSTEQQQQPSAGEAASEQQQQQQQCRAPPRAASGSWPDANPSPPSTLHDTIDSQPASSNGTAADTAQAAAAAVGRGSSIVGAACTPATGSNACRAATRDGASAAAAAAGPSKGREPAAAGKGAPKLDREMLAAVTGTSGTEDLTASQEELAAKLAKLAFATPAAARQLAGKKAPQQQQQQLQERVCTKQAANAPAAAGDWGGCEDGDDEPFYPTMMSDMCNLAEPLDDELEQIEEDPAAADGSSTQGLLSAAAAASAAQQSVLQAVQQQDSAGLQKRRQQQRMSHFKQQRASAGRQAAAAKAASSTAAAAAAGPLKSALLMRGPAARPGMARPISTGGAVAGATGAASQAAARQVCPVGGAGAGAGAYPLESFDSYFPDTDIHYHSVDTPASKPGKTFTVTEGGVVETPGVSQFAEGCGQQDGAAAAAAGGAGGMPLVRLSHAAGGKCSPPKSPKRMLGGLRDGALSCESAAAAAAAAGMESDVHTGWQDVSRSASPAIGEAGRCSPGLRKQGSRPGGSACTSVQTSTSLWPIVDASAEVQDR